jgi:hypothetical protein
MEGGANVRCADQRGTSNRLSYSETELCYLNTNMNMTLQKRPIVPASNELAVPTTKMFIKRIHGNWLNIYKRSQKHLVLRLNNNGGRS